MSNERDIVIINKMIKYCYDAIKYAENVSYEQFVKDERSLVFSVFSLSQLGELVTLLNKDVMNKYSKEIPWKAIKSVRNRIVHNYDGVQYKIIWNILSNEIMPLIESLKKILEDMKK